MAKSKKDATNPIEFIDRYYEIKEKYRGHKSIYKDGSQSDHRAAAAAVMDERVYSERLPNCSSIFSAELHVLFLALDHVETDFSHNFIIFSDSKSALESLKSKDWTNPLVLKILERHHYLWTVCDKIIIYCWVPSHIGIQGNELAD